MRSNTLTNFIIIILFILSSLSNKVIAQNIDKEKLDNYFETLAAGNKFMGSVAISKKGQVIYTKSVGYADIETGRKADKDSKYKIGSITKTFTSVLILKAVDEKKITLESTIQSYFPTIENADEIKISHLLYHRSGIFNYTNDESFFDWHSQQKTKEEMIEIISKGGSNFEPGKKFEYSNSNFVLLAYILEDAYGKPYSVLLEEKITTPLGLKNTYYGGKIDISNDECNSYTYEGKWEKSPEFNASISNGAGAIVSTPVDLTIFSNALFNGKLISKKSLEQMKTINESFGMGLIVLPFYDKKGLGHGGTIDGFRSIFAHYEKEKTSIAITSNGLNYNLNNITIVLLSSIFDKPYEIPVFKSYNITSEDLDQYLGNYSNEKYNLYIEVLKKNNNLFIKQNGIEVLFDAIEKDKFESELLNALLEFDTAKKEIILKQNGQRIILIKN